jgi:sugar/nucleoside kinase (ribokinase family)
MATPEFIASLSAAKYLAINVQTNSGNYGFNLATKYEKCDYLCVDEPESRLATQNRNGPIEYSLETLSKIAPKVVITLGKAGAIGRDHNGIVRTQAFTDTVVDTIGAGDAFFAVTALVSEEADMRSLLRIGNAAGAIKAGIVGHQRSVTKDELIEYLSRVPA